VLAEKCRHDTIKQREIERGVQILHDSGTVSLVHGLSAKKSRGYRVTTASIITDFNIFQKRWSTLSAIMKKSIFVFSDGATL